MSSDAFSFCAGILFLLLIVWLLLPLGKAVVETVQRLAVVLTLVVAFTTIGGSNFNQPGLELSGISISWLWLTYLINSLITFIIYGYDKKAATAGKWRISEWAIHLMELIGGWPGGLIGQPIFKHKINWGKEFRFKFVSLMIRIVHLAYWVWYFGLGRP